MDLFVGLFLVFLISLWYYITNLYSYWTRRGVVGPKPWPIVGNYWPIVWGGLRESELLFTIYHQYPEEKCVGFFRGITPVLMLRDPSVIKRVFEKNDTIFYSRTEVGEPVRDKVKYELWKLKRKSIASLYSNKNLEKIMPLINECVENHQKDVEESVGIGNEIDTIATLSQFNLELIYKLSLGVVFKDLPERNEIKKISRLLLNPSFPSHAIQTILSTFSFLIIWPLQQFKKFYKKKFTKLVLNVLKETKVMDQGIDTFTGRLVYLNNKIKSAMPMNELDFPCDEDFIIDNILILLSGAVTLPKTISIIIMELAYNQNIQEKVYQEIVQVLKNNDGQVTVKAINEMTYLNSVIEECLRFIITNFLFRKCATEFEFSGLNFNIDSKAQVCAPISAIVKDPQYYEEPEALKPERFTSEKLLKRKQDGTYLSFGCGPRMCVEGTWQNHTSHHTELYLQSLLKYTNYTVKVAGYSNYGVGPYSYPIVCTTLQDVPGPPSDIKVLVYSPTSLLISWRKPAQPNGELLHYTVYIKPTAGGTPQTHHVEPSRGTAEVKELTTGRTYEAWVTASTRAGEGSASRRVVHTPTHRVVAGVASLGGSISVGVGSSLLLVCQCVGVPPPRTVWYHKHNIITHHPRFTRNHDDSLLLNNIDQSLAGNYTCLAKNLYGSDSVEYVVWVLPLPDAPILRAVPNKHSILVEWEQQYYGGNKSLGQISYSLTWKEANGPWQEAWPATKVPNLAVHKHTLTGLKCGTKYSLRITATNKVGTSQPAYLDVSTLGGVPTAPSTNEWLWSNSTHIAIQAAGWDDGGCGLRSWGLHYRAVGQREWIRADAASHPEAWQSPYQQAYRPATLVIPALPPGTWYQVRVTASNEAGSVTTVYSYATKNEDGTEVGPPSEPFDLNSVVIMCSSVLVAVCVIASAYLIVRRQSSSNLYQDSITADNKSDSGNLTTHTSHTNIANIKENQATQNRIYSAPIHARNPSKHELYEISPYAQFAVGFRTFGHVDNQDLPSRHRRCDTETSFQVCSESEDSDISVSKTTLKSAARKPCRTPHHNR